MQTGPNGIAVLHYFEDCRLRAYPDPASPLFVALQRDGVNPYELRMVPTKFATLSGAPWTIAWGDTSPDVVPGLVITQAEADARFARRLAREFEPGVLNSLKRTPTQAQFDAMVCLAYNIGLGNFQPSTLVRLFNRRAPGVEDQFLRWDKAAGRVMLGLRRRRAAERALYLGATGEEAIKIGAAIR